MKNLKVLNLINNEIQCSQNFNNDNDMNFYIETYISNGAWGVKKERWLKLSEATEFEKSREDNRREVTNESETYTEIHVPNDFITTITDITSEYEYKILIQKSEFRKSLANDVLTYIDVKADSMTQSQAMALFSRSDIQQIISLLNMRSLEYSKGFIDMLTPDSDLTQEFIIDVSNYVQTKINEFNAKVFK